MILLIPLLFLIAIVMLFIGKPLALKVGLISSLLAIILLTWFSCYLYKDSVGYRQEASRFTYNMQKDDFASIYEKLNNRLKEAYNPIVFSDLLANIKDKSTCIHTEHTLISSSENFDMIIWDCTHQKKLAVITLGGNKLMHWEITNIRLVGEE